MSTSAEIGRSPIARRRLCSQSGLGPFVTPRISRPVKCGARSAASGAMVMPMGLSKPPSTGWISSGFSVPRPRAARSRAMPRTASASGRLGVI